MKPEDEAPLAQPTPEETPTTPPEIEKELANVDPEEVPTPVDPSPAMAMPHATSPSTESEFPKKGIDLVQPKKKRAGLWVLLSILLIALVGAGVFGYLYYTEEPADETSEAVVVDDTEEIVEPTSPLDTIETGAAESLAEYGDITSTRNTEATIMYQTTITEQETSIEVSGESTTLISTDEDTEGFNAAATAFIEEQLEAEGLTMYSEGIYTSDDFFCGVSDATTFCVDQPSLDAQIEEYTPIIEAYVSESGVVEETMNFTSLEIVEGGNESEIASTSVTVGDSGFVLYMYSTGEDWMMSPLSGQEAPDCAAFDTAELQQVFEGYDCYDELGELSTVTIVSTITINEEE